MIGGVPMSGKFSCKNGKYLLKVLARRRRQSRTMAALIYTASNTQRAQPLPQPLSGRFSHLLWGSR
jgi:hypothetical protein